jgi:hypothetical protein
VDERIEIRVRGRLGPAVAASFDGLDVQPDGGDTVLRGTAVDPAALYGLIDRLEALGLQLLEVRRTP